MKIKALAFLLALLCFTAVPALAETKIGVVDIEILLNESKAGKSIQSQLKAKRESFQKEFADKEKALREDEKSLMGKKDKLSADQFGEERKKFESKLLETRKLLQTRKGALDKGLTTAMQELRQNIIEVTAKTAEDGKYQLILNRDSIVIVEKEFDITKAVLAKLDEKVSSIKLKVE